MPKFAVAAPFRLVDIAVDLVVGASKGPEVYGRFLFEILFLDFVHEVEVTLDDEAAAQALACRDARDPLDRTAAQNVVAREIQIHDLDYVVKIVAPFHGPLRICSEEDNSLLFGYTILSMERVPLFV